MKYRIGEWSRVDRDFTKTFGISFRNFQDGLLTSLFGCIKIDIIKFDEWLKEKHGDEEYIGKSTEQIIHKFYGDAAVLFILQLL
jgi:hypothetical protein